ncbi:MAG: helix-turn-helix transcriptional regulator [Alphaproteobacteria bacterium]|nr:helix-turn-helix transcriptional regulator [Alphaproteobacteria bacterium]
MTLTPAQIRGCLGYLNISMEDMAKETGMSRTLIHNLVSGKTAIRDKHSAPIETYFNAKGYRFTDNGGIEPAGIIVKTYRGRTELPKFVDDIYETLKQTPSEILTYNVNEALFDEPLGDNFVTAHIARMAALKNIKCRAIIAKQDSPKKAPQYAEYRYLKNENEGDNAFYAYGDRFAIITFNGRHVEVVVLYSAAVVALNTDLFNAAWDNAEKVEARHD